jgi:dipeptidyl aminopeptidase/acylaminoacyl peptidase
MAFGLDDRRVPLEHGTRMRAALRAAGQEPEYVVYDGEGHGWLRIETQVDFARRLDAFLGRNLK